VLIDPISLPGYMVNGLIEKTLEDPTLVTTKNVCRQLNNNMKLDNYNWIIYDWSCLTAVGPEQSLISVFGSGWKDFFEGTPEPTDVLNFAYRLIHLTLKLRVGQIQGQFIEKERKLWNQMGKMDQLFESIIGFDDLDLGNPFKYLIYVLAKNLIGILQAPNYRFGISERATLILCDLWTFLQSGQHIEKRKTFHLISRVNICLYAILLKQSMKLEELGSIQWESEYILISNIPLWIAHDHHLIMNKTAPNSPVTAALSAYLRANIFRIMDHRYLLVDSALLHESDFTQKTCVTIFKTKNPIMMGLKSPSFKPTDTSLEQMIAILSSLTSISDGYIYSLDNNQDPLVFNGYLLLGHLKAIIEMSFLRIGFDHRDGRPVYIGSTLMHPAVISAVAFGLMRAAVSGLRLPFRIHPLWLQVIFGVIPSSISPVLGQVMELNHNFELRLKENLNSLYVTRLYLLMKLEASEIILPPMASFLFYMSMPDPVPGPVSIDLVLKAAEAVMALNLCGSLFRHLLYFSGEELESFLFPIK